MRLFTPHNYIHFELKNLLLSQYVDINKKDLVAFFNNTSFTDIQGQLRRLERVFLTARRMDSKIHASKLPTRQTRYAARESIGVPVENNHGRLEQLKNVGFPLLLPIELLLLEEKRRKLSFQNGHRKAQVALSWPKKDEKGFLKSESQISLLRSRFWDVTQRSPQRNGCSHPNNIPFQLCLWFACGLFNRPIT